MIYLKLNLSGIPENKIFVGQKGKYLDIVVSEMQHPDAYGNTHTAYIKKPKDSIEETIYIGKGKEIKFENRTASTPAPVQNLPEDDLPF